MGGAGENGEMRHSHSHSNVPVVSRFEIQLEGGDGLVVHGGETLRGNILVQLNEKTTLQAVGLQVMGRAQWIGDGQAKQQHDKVYFNQDMTLLERPPGRPAPGHFPWQPNFLYTLPFECPIPKGCPTSYESPFGSIRYYVKARLLEEDEKGTSVKESYVKKAFMLLAPSDGAVLNHSDGPEVTVDDVATFGKCCCKGKISSQLSLSKTFYAPGEDVFGTIKLNGKTPKRILDQVEVRVVDRVLLVGTPEKMGASPWRTLSVRRVEQKSEKEQQKSKKEGRTLDGIYLTSIPPVLPSTKGDFDSATGELAVLSPSKGPLAKVATHAVYESPSTATLRIRKQPFLRIQYAIQVSIGNILILEAPMTVVEVPHSRAGSSALHAFVGGAQPIEDASDDGKSAFGGPFSFTPSYPVHDGTRGDTVQPHNGEAVRSPSAAVTVSSPRREEEEGVQRVKRAEDTAREPREGEDNVATTHSTHSSHFSSSSLIVQPPQSKEHSPPSEHVSPLREEPKVEYFEPETNTTTQRREETEELKDENGEVIGTVTKTTITTESTTSQLVEMSGGGDAAVAEIRERLEDGWGPEGDEGVDTETTTTSQLVGDDGEVISTTTTTKVLKRVKRQVEGEEEAPVAESSAVDGAGEE